MKHECEDERLRALTRDKTNGDYAIVICRNCGEYLSRTYGKIEEAVITDLCPSCHPDLKAWRK